MKTIQEASEEHRQKGLMMLSNIKLIDYVTVANREKSAFEAGVEFAQRWIPVSEELPDYGEKVLVMVDDISGKIFENNFIDLDHVVSIAPGKKSFLSEVDFFDQKVTHWRPINYK